MRTWAFQLRIGTRHIVRLGVGVTAVYLARQRNCEKRKKAAFSNISRRLRRRYHQAWRGVFCWRILRLSGVSVGMRCAAPGAASRHNFYLQKNDLSVCRRSDGGSQCLSRWHGRFLCLSVVYISGILIAQSSGTMPGREYHRVAGLLT